MRNNNLLGTRHDTDPLATRKPFKDDDFLNLPVWWNICVAFPYKQVQFLLDRSPAVENGTKGGHEST